MTAIAPLETPIELYDIELEALLDGAPKCSNPRGCDNTAINVLVHDATRCPGLACGPCTTKTVASWRRAETLGIAFHCPDCGENHITPDRLSFRPI